MSLTACGPSNKYAGEWYGNPPDGSEIVTLNFSPEKVLTISHEDGTDITYEFSQFSSGFINEVRYFGLNIENETYYVIFDHKKDEKNAKFVKQTNVANDFKDVVGDVIYHMYRE